MRILLLSLMLSLAAGVSLAESLNMGMVRSEYIQPLELPAGLDREKVALGEALFHDARLSKDGSVSCASCHLLEQGGMDGLPKSFGVDGAVGEFNTPTIFNALFNSAQFWDGRADSLEAQIDGPLLNPREMGSSWSLVLQRIGEDSALSTTFEKLYEDGLSVANVRHAIATFERSLVTLDAPFDRYLKGDSGALSDDQRKGYELFKSYGCVACHQGQNVGGNLFQKIGVMRDYFAGRESVSEADLGRFRVTGDEDDRHVFKVPSLRLTLLTAPYFHDGSIETLEEAIQVMASYQLGRPIPEEDVRLIIAFLESLVGSYRGATFDE